MAEVAESATKMSYASQEAVKPSAPPHATEKNVETMDAAEPADSAKARWSAITESVKPSDACLSATERSAEPINVEASAEPATSDKRALSSGSALGADANRIARANNVGETDVGTAVALVSEILAVRPKGSAKTSKKAPAVKPDC